MTAIDRDALARAMTERARLARPLDARVDAREPVWVLVVTPPGCDDKARRWLARRRFGVFQPMQLRRLARGAGAQPNGRHAPQFALEPTFPGYLFVRLWPIGNQLDRLRHVPGVESVIELPARRISPRELLVQEFVDMLHAEHEKAGGALVRLEARDHAAVAGGRRRRRRRKSHKMTRAAAVLMAQLGQLDAEGRIALLLDGQVPRLPPVAGRSASGHGGESRKPATDRGPASAAALP